MKKAFTMIELIFVIVILGILAAIAIPRLNSTRTDAEVSKATMNVSTLVHDLGSYYAARGRLSSELSDMTSVGLISSTTPPSLTGLQMTLAGVPCLNIDIVDAVGSVPAYVLFRRNPTSSSNHMCAALYEMDIVRAYLNASITYGTGTPTTITGVALVGGTSINR